MLYQHCIRRLLFAADAEWIHNQSVRFVSAAGRYRATRAMLRCAAPKRSARLGQDFGAFSLEHPIALAAGWDKNGAAVLGTQALGFAACEIGSVSSRPSNGNEAVRLWRVPRERALVVNYGLPNVGAKRVAELLDRQMDRFLQQDSDYRVAQGRVPWKTPLGINLVATNDAVTRAASCDEIVQDYQTSAKVLARYADYLTLNLSCPNTELVANPFADAAALTSLLEAVSSVSLQKPIFLKIQPSLDPKQIEYWLEHCHDFAQVRGFIVNLPPGNAPGVDRRTSKFGNHPGAISGPPVRELMLSVLDKLHRAMPKDRYLLVGGGGIETGDDVFDFLAAGASFVQIYTALVYQGPFVVKNMLRGLQRRMDSEGFRELSDVIGSRA